MLIDCKPVSVSDLLTYIHKKKERKQTSRTIFEKLSFLLTGHFSLAFPELPFPQCLFFYWAVCPFIWHSITEK